MKHITCLAVLFAGLTLSLISAAPVTSRHQCECGPTCECLGCECNLCAAPNRPAPPRREKAKPTLDVAALNPTNWGEIALSRDTRRGRPSARCAKTGRYS